MTFTWLPQINVGGLPQLDVPVKPSGVLPDPAQLLKVKGETFAADYAYNGRLYTVYTYACMAEDAAALYRSQAQSAGYQAQTIQAEGFTAFEFTFEGAFKDGSVTYENGSFRAEMHR